MFVKIKKKNTKKFKKNNIKCKSYGKIINTYGSDNMLSKAKKIKTESNFVMSRKNLKSYLKWLEHIPKHYNIEQLLKKSTKELSNEEIEILKLLKEEIKYKNILRQYLKSNESKILISNEVYNYMNKMHIDKYAKIKLTEDELEYSQKMISYYSTMDKIEVAIIELSQKEDKNLIEEYILFELEKKSYSLGLQRLNNEIIETVEENRKKDLIGYEKCINFRIR